MPKTKIPHYRYRILNKCFQNPRGYTIEELIRIVSEKLNEDFGIKSVSERTIRYDINIMRSDPPRGFGAPIIVQNGRYKYKNPNFSIEKLTLSIKEIKLVKEVLYKIQKENFTGKNNMNYKIRKFKKIILKMIQNSIEHNRDYDLLTDETIQPLDGKETIVKHFYVPPTKEEALQKIPPFIIFWIDKMDESDR